MANVARSASEKYVDLGHDIFEGPMQWPGSLPYKRVDARKGFSDSGYWYSTLVIIVSAKVEEDPNAELTTDDLMEWLGEHGPLPDGVILLLRTGWGTRFGNRTAYYGTDGNDTSKLAFPGFSPGAAQLLVGYEAATGRRVFGVGLDTPSLDYGPSTLFTSHVEFSSANIFGLENVANLKKLPTTGFHLTVMPMKIKGGSGAPARIIATLPEVRSASIPTQRDSSATSLITKASLHYYMGVILLLLQGCI
ncbi:Isatin hydrolase-like 2 [Homarus americanus]|uniref:Isatin hydrolase-like 2 n=1 Tax=Homarus americanus TaxID=6706 RepID=A0A8J5MNG4_HOMAM|nr:Isatin hydrolase-like 2 [Homarus americanus]